MRNLLRGTLTKLGLKTIATRLLDEPQKTTDVTPPPHITPCGKDARREQNKSPDSPRGPGFFRKRNRRN
jgi:hypothetical protein